MFDPPPTNQQTDVKVNKGSYTSNHQQVSQILHISLKTIGHSSFYLSFLSIYKSTWYTICILYAYNGVTETSACIKNMYYIWVTSHLDGFKTKVFYSMNRKTILKFVYVHALRNKSWFYFNSEILFEEKKECQRTMQLLTLYVYPMWP